MACANITILDTCTSNPCMTGCPDATACGKCGNAACYTCNTTNCPSPSTCVDNVCTAYTCSTTNCPSPNTCVGNVCTPPVEANLIPGVFTVPETVAVNEQFVVSQVVSNTGTAAGMATVVFTVGVESKTATATVPAGGSVTLTALFTAIVEGVVDVYTSVNGGTPLETKIITVTTGGGSMGMILGILGIALIGGFMLMSGDSTPKSDSGGIASLDKVIGT